MTLPNQQRVPVTQESMDTIFVATSRILKHAAMLLLVLLAMSGVFWKASSLDARTAVAYGLPFVALGFLWLACCAARFGPNPAHRLALVIGLLVILGGIVFDIGATIYHSPNLSRESNPVARFLLNGGHSLPFVYAYGFVVQAALAGILSMLWWGYLRNYQRWLNCALVHRPASFAAFVKACAGGGDLPWARFLFKIKPKDPIAAYQMLWFIALLILPVVSDRWYWGMRWFEWVPEIESTVRFAACIILSFGSITMWLYWKYRHWKANTTA